MLKYVSHASLKSRMYFIFQALQWILKNSLIAKPPDMRPYRVLISLLEKPEIGPTILDDILIDVFR